MKRKELKFAACVLAGTIAVSGMNVSTQATQVVTVLPVAGVGLVLEEGTSLEELGNINLTYNDQVMPEGENVSSDTDGMTAGEAAVLGENITDMGGGDNTVDSDTENGDSQNNNIEDTDASQNASEAGNGSESNTDTGNPDEGTAGEEASEESNDETDTEDESSEEDDEEDYANLVIAQVNDWVNVRSGPSTDTEIVGKLYNNSVGEMLWVEGDWYYITSGTVVGYVKAEYCVTGEEAEAMVDEVSVRTATVETTTLKLRSEPSTDSRVLELLPEGQVLEVTGTETEGWVEVDVDGTTGYVSADYVRVDVSFVSAESREEEEARLAAERARREEEERRAAQARQAQQDAAAAAAAEQPAAPDPAPVTVSGSGSGAEVANFALQYVGNPYVYGGTSLTNGADCSGFVLAVYAHFGVSLPHSATADRYVGTEVGSLAEARPGDLVCYSGHVGIYIGNGQIVHASTARTGIKVSDVNYKQYVCIRRIFN